MKITLLFSNKRNAIHAFLKIKIFILSYLSVAAFLFVLTSAHAMRKTTDPKVSITSSKNTLWSTYTVGASGNYTTLKAAFDAINAGSITGVITLQIISSTTETATAALNASGSGLANYSSVLIYATGTGYSISCNINSALVNFNGADNVVIDGRVNATGSTADLTFTNSNTGINACALRMVNSAENNTIKYATLTASGLSLATAVVNFSTSGSGNGNDFNIIEYCNVSNAGGNRPFNGILSSGSAGRENSSNIIRNNAIYNFTNDTNNSFGVNISIYSTDWNINGNSFYETTPITPTGGYSYGGIRVATPNMHTVSGNYIGGSQPLCGGTPWTMTSSFSTNFSGIFITGTTTTPTIVQNNTIQNFNYSTTNANPWDGVYLSSGNISILGNTIGADTGTNSIVVTTPNVTATATLTGGVVTAINLVGGGSGFTTAPSITFTTSGSTTPAIATAIISAGVVTGFTIIDGGSGYTSIPNINVNGSGYSTTHGIRCLNSGTVNVENNTIGSITTFGNSAYSHCFEGMVISGFPTSIVTINNNLIGSLTTANSIKTGSPATASIFKQDLRGIYINSAVNLATITGNTIGNMTSSYTGNSTSKVDGICCNANNNVIQNNTIRDITACINSITVRGIQQYVTTAGTNQTLTGNTIYNLSNTHPTASVGVMGIDYTGPASGINTISGNFVHSLSISSNNTLSQICGIGLGNGLTTISNNIVSLGTGINTGYRIYGIYDNNTITAGNNNSVYFNTVYVAGTVTSGDTYSTAALWNSNTSSIRNYRNNVLMNVRTGGTSGKHYAIRISGLSGLTIDNNDYYTAGGTFLGYFVNDPDKTTLAAWKTATAQDANSLNTNPLFANTGGTNPLNYYPSAILPAATGTGIANDYTGLARSATPKMGALEITGYVWSGATSTNFGTASNWQNGIIPPDGSDISFAFSPSNNCNLDQDRSLRNITNAQSTYKFVINGHQLTLLGNLIFSNGAKMDATAASSLIEFRGAVAQNIPSGALVSNILNGCKLNNIKGLSINDDITITQSLALSTGALTIGAHTLTLNGTVAVVDGTLVGGITTNIIIGGSGAASLPVVALNNLTVNRATGVNLVGSVAVAGTLALNNGTLSVGANTLTVSGNSPTRISGAIDASDVAATIIFSNTTAIVLPASIFATAVNNLAVNGLDGITSAGDFTVNGEVNLQGNNPSATKGLLDMWDGSAAKTVTMGPNATNIGMGDTTGIIKRTSVTAGVSYTFGSPFMKVYLNNTGTLPSQLSLKLSIGTTPAWRTGAINREIEVLQTGAVAANGVFSFHYLDSELNGNDEDHLVLWVKIGNTEYGSSAYNATDNWVSLSNVNVAFFSSAFDGTKNITLDEYSTTNTITWNGSLSTSWTSIENWTPNVGPSGTKNIIIPDAATTPNDPILPSITDIKSLTIEAGAILNSVALAQVTIEGTNAWNNYGGTFNANTSNILFNNAAATMSGTTDFYDLTINSGKTLSMTEGCNMRIAGAMNNNGIWNTLSSGSAFVEYNGAAQTIVNPNGATAGYSNLILSGSGTKTMVSALQSIYGNLSLVGTVTTTAAANLNIGKSLIIGNGTTFNNGNFNHTIKGDFDNSGTFNTASGYTILLNGNSPQSILGTSTTTFNQLTINNTAGVTMYSNVNIGGTFALTNGIFKVEATLGILGTITKTAGFVETGTNSSLAIGGSGAIVLQSDLFSAIPTINNFTVNRSGGVTLGQEMSVNGVLNLVLGTLNISDNNLTIGALGTVSVISPNATKMIVASGMGEVRKIMVSGSSFRYPIGDNTGTAEYTPITITLADDGAPDNYYGVKVINAKHPDNASTSNYLNRYWSLNRSGNIPHLATVSATYTSADIIGTETNIAGADLVGNFNQSNNPWVKHNALSTNLLSIASIVLTSNQTTVFSGISAANPSVSILGTGDSCSGSNVPLSTLVTGDSNFIYTWTPSDFLSSTTIANPIATAINATTLYTVIVKDGNGISATASGTVTIGTTTTWTGSWSNGAPSSTTSVIISANYTPVTSFECCSLTVNNNAVVSIPSGINVTLNGILTVVSGSNFTLQSNANLIQTTNAPNSGNITVLRNSALIKRLDHTLWSSPVTGTQTLQQFSPNTLSNRFYVYNILNNTYSSTPATGYFPLAKAIAVRAPNNWSTTEATWPGSFTGVPNNGTITTPLENTGAAYNGIGNPYPSTISGTELVNANSPMITGTLYFYAHTLAINATTGLFPPGTNYAVWNPGMGGTPATVGGGGTGSSPVTPNGIIQTGQGFLVKATAQGNMIFTNSMRKTNTANQFFKNITLKSNTAEPDIERHRIWLNLGSSTGALNTILVGYAAGATSGIDYGYDGLKFGGSGSELYSIITGDAYSIQGRALPFIADDNVSLGFKATEAGTFTIAIYKTDGLFSGDQDILIKDNLMGTTNSIKTTPYNFTSDIGTFDGRFEMVYTKGSLGIDTEIAIEEGVIIFTKNNTLFVQNSHVITTVRIFDVLGRLLSEYENINDTHFQRDKSSLTRQVVLVEVTDNENRKVIKKIVF